jgi:hypothetical protein
LLIATAPLSSSCGCEGPPDGLAVNLQTDFVPLVEFDTIRTTVDETMPRMATTTSTSDFTRPRLLTTYDAVDPGRRSVEVTLTRAGSVIARRRVTIAFSGSYLQDKQRTRRSAQSVS